jgi:hypothetical protein
MGVKSWASHAAKICRHDSAAIAPARGVEFEAINCLWCFRSRSSNPTNPRGGSASFNSTLIRTELFPFFLIWVIQETFRKGVPRPFGSAQGRLLRSLQGRDAILPVRCGLSWRGSASHLRRPSTALYHLLLLSPITFSAHHAQPRPLSHDSGTDPPALPLRCRGIRRHARTHPSAHHRTRDRKSIHRDASLETTHRPRPAAEEKRIRPTSALSVRRGPSAHTVLAGSLRFYDFNVWTTKKRGEKLRYMHRNPVKRGL